MVTNKDLIITFFVRVFHAGFHVLLSWIYGKKVNTIPPIKDNILKKSATELAFRIRTKQVKSEGVVKAYIDRILIVNPIINAVNEDRFTAALKEAKEIDFYLSQTNKTFDQIARETPFLGVPVTCKNSIGIKGLAIDTGVVYRKGRKADQDSEVIRRMRLAGAIPICVSNVPELTMWMDAANKIYGRTLNPYDLNRIPGGSSGGECSLIASSGSIIGIGSDLAGSIRSPCFSCGIFGHYTTPLVVPQDGQFPTTHDNDFKNYSSTGPLCRYAEDLLPMLKVLAGDTGKRLNLEKKVDLHHINLYYARSYIKSPYNTPIHKVIENSVSKVVDALQKRFNVKAFDIDLTCLNQAMELWFSKVSTANGPSFEYFLTDGNYKINSYWELFKWFFRLSNHTLHTIFFLLAWRWHPEVEPRVASLNSKIVQQLKERLASLLGDDGVLIYPPQPEVAIFHQEQVFKQSNWGYTAIFNALGFPVTQCPVGLDEGGLPLGVQVVSTPYNDRISLAVAREIENVFGGWRAP